MNQWHSRPRTEKHHGPDAAHWGVFPLPTQHPVLGLLLIIPKIPEVWVSV